jgi:hypothetical protein
VIKELLDQRAQGVGLREARDLVAEFEAVQNLLDVGGEAIKVGLEIGLELLLAGAGAQVLELEL